MLLNDNLMGTRDFQVAECMCDNLFWVSFLSCGFNSRIMHIWGFAGGSVIKNTPANAGDSGDGTQSLSWVRNIPQEEEMATHSLQYSCLENSMDRGAWQDIVLGSQRVRHNWAHTHTYTHTHTAHMNTCTGVAFNFLQSNSRGKISWSTYNHGSPGRRPVLCAPGVQRWWLFENLHVVLLFSCHVTSNSLWPHRCSTPGLLVLHYLPEFGQIHVHWVSDALQPSSVAKRSENLHYVFSKSVLRQLLRPRAVLAPLALIPYFQNRDTKCFIFFLLQIAPMHSNACLSTAVFHSWNGTSTSFTSPFPMSWKA